MNYSEEELEKLHHILIEILEETIRVCDKLSIPYFIQGGTAIGAFFYKRIIPWDDDIDIGMTRENYNRFIAEAPKVIGENYSLQCFQTEPCTPNYWLKIMKKNTAFVEEAYADLKIDRGIFIDIFPFDNVPDSKWQEVIQRKLCVVFSTCLSFRQIGRKYASLHLSNNRFGHYASHILTFLVKLFPAKFYYRILEATQTFFNKRKTKFVSIVRMPKDQIPIADIQNTTEMDFDRLKVNAPNHLEEYLRHHYPNLRRDIPKNEQINHKPLILLFDKEFND